MAAAGPRDARLEVLIVWPIRIGTLCAVCLPAALGCRPTMKPRPTMPLVGQRLDPGGARKDDQSAILWYDARHLPIEGKGWDRTDAFYDRLPAKAKTLVREPVWNLSRHSAGLCVRFVTDSPVIRARWTVTSSNLAMDHMPATGVSGLDLYVRNHGRWRWLGTGRPRGGATNEVTLADGVPAGMHEYRLYLPLYNGTKSLEIGVDAASVLAAPAGADIAARPICVYGTSITQGGCASRPGMAYPAILGRRLGRPVINLGFSGNGRMEPELAELLCELDVAVYVLDCLPNMTAEMVRDRVPPFVRRLREAHPRTPILLVENLTYQNAHFLPASREQLVAKNEALRTAYRRLVASGVTGLLYVPGGALIGGDGEATVDGAHPTDLGFVRIADSLEPVLRAALRQG